MSLLQQNPPPFPRLFATSSDPHDPRRWLDWSRIPLGWRLLGILLMCLIPRIWIACLIRSACHDAYYYISVASACQNGNWAEAFVYLVLNIYPLILLGLKSLGFDWLWGGKIWSVLISSLAVLPLFGWVRRLFCDQVAWSACFLYSLHAEFVEFSSEPVRDPTFWFLFNLSLYTSLRAISEMKFRWFLAGGLTVALAVHTRSEGWLLTIPFVMWLSRQLVVNRNARRRLAWGGAIWFAVTPLLILLINVTLLRGQPEWKLGRLTHFRVGWQWLMEHANPPEAVKSPAEPPARTATSQPTAGPQGEPGAMPAAKLPAGAPAVILPPLPAGPVSVKFYFKEMASALEQINLGLLVFGLCWLRRGLWDWDQGALFLVSLALAGSVWIFYDHYGILNGRYFFPIYFALMPYFGTGLLLVWNALWAGARRLEWSWLKPEYTAIFIVGLAIGLGWVDALTTNFEERDQEADVGVWLGETHGPFPSILTDLESSRAGYHARHATPTIMHHWSLLESHFRNQACDLLLLSTATTPPDVRPLVDDWARRAGLEPILLPEDHPASQKFLAFARPAAKPPHWPTAARIPPEGRRQ